MVGEHERRHRLHNRHGAREHAGIVATAPDDFAGRSRRRHARLRLGDGRRRLERDAERDFFSVGNSALNAAGTVRPSADFSVAHFEHVVVPRAGQQRSREAAADFKTFRRGKRKHRLGEIRFEPVENRFAQPRGNAADAASDRAADGIAVRPRRTNALRHFFRDFGNGTAHGNAFDFFLREKFVGRRHRDFRHAFHETGKRDFRKKFSEDFFCDRARRDAPDGFARGGAPAAVGIADSVFRRVSEIRVRRTEKVAQRVIRLRSLIRVADEQGDRRSRRQPAMDAGKNFDAVALVPRRGKVALPGTPPVEFPLDFLRRQRKLGRAAVDDDADSAAVAFAECRNLKKFSENAAHTTRNQIAIAFPRQRRKSFFFRERALILGRNCRPLARCP